MKKIPTSRTEAAQENPSLPISKWFAILNEEYTQNNNQFLTKQPTLTKSFIGSRFVAIEISNKKIADTSGDHQLYASALFRQISCTAL